MASPSADWPEILTFMPMTVGGQAVAIFRTSTCNWVFWADTPLQAKLKARAFLAAHYQTKVAPKMPKQQGVTAQTEKEPVDAD